MGPWAPFQYPIRRLMVRSREVSKPRDWCLELSNCSEIWQAHRQHCCRGACQISERCDKSHYQSRGFETSRDLAIRRLSGYWNGALVSAMVTCMIVLSATFILMALGMTNSVWWHWLQTLTTLDVFTLLNNIESMFSCKYIIVFYYYLDMHFPKGHNLTWMLGAVLSSRYVIYQMKN